MCLNDKTTPGNLNNGQTFEQSVHGMLQENVPSHALPPLCCSVTLVWGRESGFEAGGKE